MPFDSQRVQRLDQEWKEGLEKSGDVERDYTFYASALDSQVPDYESTLLDVEDQTVRYAIVPGHGHESIVDAVADELAESIAP